MNIKSLLLGSAAALAAVSGAQAADAIVAAEPEPLEYVRVCDAFGTGYFYIPGTETCLKIGGYVRFQVDAGPNEFAGTNDWDAWTRGRVAVTSKTDTELGELTGFIAIHGESTKDTRGTGAGNDSFYFDEVYLQLGGFKAGTYLNWWDKGINGETDKNAGDAATRFTSIAYVYTGDTFSAGVQLDELSGLGDGSGYGAVNNDVGVEGLVTFKLGGAALDILGSYDVGIEEGAVRVLGSVPVGPGVLQGFVTWASDASRYYGITGSGGLNTFAGEWAVAASYAIKATDKFTITPGFNYVWDKFYNGEDDWRAGVTVDYKVTDGMAVKVTANYQDDPDTWTGFVRLQRDF